MNGNTTADTSPRDELDAVLGFIRNASVYDYIPAEWKSQSAIPSDIHDKAMKKLRAEATDRLNRLMLTERRKELVDFNLPQYDHSKCLDPKTCIGYQNAQSDFDNEKELRLAAIDAQLNKEEK